MSDKHICNINGCTKSFDKPGSLKKHRQRDHTGYSATFFANKIKKATESGIVCKFCLSPQTSKQSCYDHKKRCKSNPANSHDGTIIKKASNEKKKEEKKEEKKEKAKYNSGLQEEKGQDSNSQPMPMQEQLDATRNYAMEMKAQLDAVNMANQWHNFDKQYQQAQKVDDDADLWISKKEEQDRQFRCNQFNRGRNSTDFASAVKDNMPELPVAAASSKSVKKSKVSKKPFAPKKKFTKVIECRGQSVQSSSLVPEANVPEPQVILETQVEPMEITEEQVTEIQSCAVDTVAVTATIEDLAALDSAIIVPEPLTKSPAPIEEANVPAFEGGALIKLKEEQPLLTLGVVKRTQRIRTKVGLQDKKKKNLKLEVVGKVKSFDLLSEFPHQPMTTATVMSMMHVGQPQLHLPADLMLASKAKVPVDHALLNPSPGSIVLSLKDPEPIQQLLGNVIQTSESFRNRADTCIASMIEYIDKKYGDDPVLDKYAKQWTSIKTDFKQDIHLVWQEYCSLYTPVLTNQVKFALDEDSTWDSASTVIEDELFNSVSHDQSMQCDIDKAVSQLQIAPKIPDTSLLRSWTVSHSYAHLHLQRLITGLQIYRREGIPFKFFIKCEELNHTTLVQLLQTEELQKLLDLDQQISEIMQQQLLETRFELQINEKVSILRRCLCTFKNETQAALILSQTTASKHPQHLGLCIMILHPSDPRWEDNSREWVRIKPKGSIYHCLEDSEPALMRTSFKIDKQLEIDIEVDRAKQWHSSLLANDKKTDTSAPGSKVQASSKDKEDPFETKLPERLECAQRLSQFGGRITTLRQKIDESNEAKLKSLAEDRKRMKSKKRKTLAVAPATAKKMEPDPIMDDAIEEFSLKVNEKLPSLSKNRLIKVLVDCHRARTLLKIIKVFISKSIQNLFKKKMSPTEKIAKEACKNVKQAFQYLIEDLKNQVKVYKRCALTAILADEVDDNKVYARLYFTDCPSYIPEKERVFTYQSPILKQTNIVSEYIYYQMPKGFASTRLRRIVNDTVNKKFKSTATVYMNKLKDICSSIHDISAFFENFNDAISNQHSKMQETGLIGQSNRARISQLKRNPLLAECLQQCSLNLLLAVSDTIQKRKREMKKIEEKQDKFILKKKEMVEEMNFNLASFLRTARNSGTVRSRKRLYKRRTPKSVINCASLSLVNEFLAPVNRCQAYTKTLQEYMDPLMQILQSKEIAVRKCTAEDLIKYSLDIDIVKEMTKLKQNRDRLSVPQIVKAFNYDTRLLRQMEADLGEQVFIINTKEEEDDYYKQTVITCSTSANTSAPTVNAQSQQQAQSAQNTGTSEQNMDDGSGNNKGGNGNGDGKDNDDGDDELFVIDTSTKKGECCDYCSKVAKLHEREVLLELLPQNHEWRKHFESWGVETDLHFKTMMLCQECVDDLAKRAKEFIDEHTKKKAKQEAAPEEIKTKKEGKKPPFRMPQNHIELYFAVASHINEDNDLLRKTLLQRWARLRCEGGSSVDVDITWHYLHPFDKIEIISNIQAAYAINLSKDCPKDFRGTIYQLPSEKQMMGVDLLEYKNKLQEDSYKSITYPCWQYNHIGKICRTMYKGETQDEYNNYLSFVHDSKSKFIQEKMKADEKLKTLFKEMYCKQSFDERFLNFYLQLTQKDEIAYAQQLHVCEICKYREALYVFEACVQFISPSRMPLRYRSMSTWDKHLQYEAVRSCTECKLENEIKMKLWLRDNGLTYSPPATTQLQEMRLRKQTDVQMHIYRWGFHPTKPGYAKFLHDGSQSPKITDRTDDAFYDLEHRLRPLKVEHKKPYLLEDFQDYVFRRELQRRVEQQDKQVDTDDAWVLKTGLKPDEEKLWQSLKQVEPVPVSYSRKPQKYKKGTLDIPLDNEDVKAQNEKMEEDQPIEIEAVGSQCSGLKVDTSQSEELLFTPLKSAVPVDHSLRLTQGFSQISYHSANTSMQSETKDVLGLFSGVETYPYPQPEIVPEDKTKEITLDDLMEDKVPTEPYVPCESVVNMRASLKKLEQEREKKAHEEAKQQLASSSQNTQKFGGQFKLPTPKKPAAIRGPFFTQQQDRQPSSQTSLSTQSFSLVNKRTSKQTQKADKENHRIDKFFKKKEPQTQAVVQQSQASKEYSFEDDELIKQHPQKYSEFLAMKKTRRQAPVETIVKADTIQKEEEKAVSHMEIDNKEKQLSPMEVMELNKSVIVERLTLIKEHTDKIKHHVQEKECPQKTLDSFIASPLQCQEVIDIDEEEEKENYWSSGYKVNLEDDQYQTLQPERYLDEVIINTYSHIINAWLKKQDIKKVYAFSTYLFRQMNSEAPHIAMTEISRALGRTGNAQLADFDLLLVPIHDSLRQHWVLAIVDNRSQTVHIANSLRGAHYAKAPGVPDRATKAANPMQEYVVPMMTFLNERYASYSNVQYKFSEEMIVQQGSNNGFDCGIFVMFCASAVAHSRSIDSLTKGAMAQLDAISWPDRRVIMKQAIQESRLLDIVGEINKRVQGKDSNQRQISQQLNMYSNRMKLKRQTADSSSQRNQDQVDKHRGAAKRQRKENCGRNHGTKSLS